MTTASPIASLARSNIQGALGRFKGRFQSLTSRMADMHNTLTIGPAAAEIMLAYCHHNIFKMGTVLALLDQAKHRNNKAGLDIFRFMIADDVRQNWKFEGDEITVSVSKADESFRYSNRGLALKRSLLPDTVAHSLVNLQSPVPLETIIDVPFLRKGHVLKPGSIRFTNPHYLVIELDHKPMSIGQFKEAAKSSRYS